jgi:hypothetical protein
MNYFCMERPSDEIASKVEEVKTGNSTVVETGHTVIMNWNAQLVPLLKQLAVAKAERPGTFDAPIVILANVDKVRSIHWFPYDPVGVVNADP